MGPESSQQNTQKWTDFVREFEERGGKDVRGIDEHIKETVAAFNALGMKTHNSCEGHRDHGIGAPYITFGRPPEPRFKGEVETFRDAAEKFGLPLEEVKLGLHHDATREALHEAERHGETAEYINWREEIKKMLPIAQAVLDEFYHGKKVIPGSRLIVELEDLGSISLHNEGVPFSLKPNKQKPSELTEEEMQERMRRLRSYRAEMDALGTFLKNKFLEDKNE